MRRKRIEIWTAGILKANIKRCNDNAARQRRKMIDLQGTGREVRIRPQYWEQVAADYKRILTSLNAGPDNEVCKCGGKEYLIAPIVGARCNTCRQPLPNRGGL